MEVKQRVGRVNWGRTHFLCRQRNINDVHTDKAGQLKCRLTSGGWKAGPEMVAVGKPERGCEDVRSRDHGRRRQKKVAGVITI